MNEKAFIGRKDELEQLVERSKQKGSQLIVVKGRRRIGKSRLLLEFAKCLKKAYLFSGLLPVE